MTEPPTPDDRAKEIRRHRYLAAVQLERFGWAIVRYAAKLKRACQHPSPEHEAAATHWFEELTARRRVFAHLRSVFLRAQQ